MTLISLLIFFVVFGVFAFAAWWVISKFIPEPAKMIAFGIVGVILLIVLLMQFFPQASGYRLWH